MNVAFRPEIIPCKGAQDQGQAAAEKTGEKGRKEPGQDREHDQGHGDSGEVAEGGEYFLRPSFGAEVPREGNESGPEAGEKEDAKRKALGRSLESSIEAESKHSNDEVQAGNDTSEGKSDKPAHGIDCNIWMWLAE